MADETDYMQKYDEFWREIVEHPDGTLNRDQVARELFDYSNLIDQATEVYCHVTGDAISNPNTLPGAVIGVHDERVMEITEAAVRDAVESLIEGLEDAELAPFRSTAEVVALVRDLTGVAAVAAIAAPGEEGQ